MNKLIQKNKIFPLLVLMAFFSYGISYLFNLVLSHNLPRGMYGDFTIALKTLPVISFCILLGTNSSAKRFLSAYLAAHNYRFSSDYIQWTLKIIWRSSTIYILFLIMLLITMIGLHLFQIKNIATY